MSRKNQKISYRHIYTLFRKGYSNIIDIELILFKTIFMEDELREPNGVTAGTSIPFWKHDTLTSRKEQNTT